MYYPFLVSGYKPATGLLSDTAVQLNAGIRGVFTATSERIVLDVNPSATTMEIAALAERMREVYESIGWRNVRVEQA